MIDLNTLISNALNAAVQQAVAPLNERITALEKNEEYLTNRIAALENNPAQGVDTQAPSVLAAQYTPISNEQIKVALQEWATTGGFVTREQVEAMIEQSMDHHLECYDHDNYDEMASKVDDLPDNLDDYATRDELRSEIEDVLNNATLSLSI